jgi:ACR3 family arsenite efflux pump ArsB
MNLIIQRIIRQGLTLAAGYLTSKGILAVDQADAWTAAGTEFGLATALALLAFGWSTFNAKLLKKKA